VARAIAQVGAEMAPAVVAQLQAAVRIDSVNPAHAGTGGEGAVQAFVAAELERIGCRVEMWEPDADALVSAYPFLRASVPAEGFRGRPNVLGWFPATAPPDGRRVHLILNSHADTVAPGDPAAWPFAPLSATVSDGRMFGLGTVDAKGCLVTFLGALGVLHEAGIILREPVLIQSVADEENGGAGTLDCIRRGYTASAAVVGEPTSLVVCPGTRGSVTLALRVTGRRAHPGEGWRGVNAIQMAWRYVQALEQLRLDLERTAMHPLWRPLPAGHVWNLTALNSGPPGPAVPDGCELQYNIGAIGGERLADLRSAVEAVIALVTAEDAWLAAHPPELRWVGLAMDPALTDPEHPAVRAFVAAGRELGEPAAVTGLSAITDGRHLVNSGGIPTINFGPGEIHRCHSPEEALPLEELRRATTWVAAFTARYCGVAPESRA